MYVSVLILELRREKLTVVAIIFIQAQVLVLTGNAILASLRCSRSSTSCHWLLICTLGCAVHGRFCSIDHAYHLFFIESEGSEIVLDVFS